MRGILPVLCSACVLAPSVALAIVTRDDVPIARYVQAAALLPSYCELALPDGGGALVAPNWVLTAAHLAPIKVGQRILCGKELLTVQEVHVHPAYDGNVGRHDLALLKLAQPSRQVPLTIATVAPTPGEIVHLIGHYQGGTGLTGGVGRTPAGLRGATNRVSTSDAHWLKFVMDPPSSQHTTPLEGVSGGGDSGAPAFLMKSGRPVLVGVGSRNSDSNENGREQDYGDTDIYVSLPGYRDWIERVEQGRGNALWTVADRYVEWGSPTRLAALAGLAVLSLSLLAFAFARQARWTTARRAAR